MPEVPRPNSGMSTPLLRRTLGVFANTSSGLIALGALCVDPLATNIEPSPALRLSLWPDDRAGRSEGTAYVTYELKEDAMEAIKQFDGANANGTIPT